MRLAALGPIAAALIFTAPAIQAQRSGSDIGYPSPEAALQALRARPDIVLSEQSGWITAADRANQTVWLFARNGDPAYPTAVKRSPVQTDKGWVLGSRILCGASQATCDRVAATFGH